MQKNNIFNFNIPEVTWNIEIKLSWDDYQNIRNTITGRVTSGGGSGERIFRGIVISKYSIRWFIDESGTKYHTKKQIPSNLNF